MKLFVALFGVLLVLNSATAQFIERAFVGSGAIVISGELQQWHKVSLILDGPFAHELDNEPNPFLDYRMTVTFTHSTGEPSYKVPGYFAADGNAAHSSAESGTKWKAHFSPDKTGRWSWSVEFVRGANVAIDPHAPFEHLTRYEKHGTLHIDKTLKRGRDFRSHGRLGYAGERYLRFAGSGDYFLKAGADSPENLLAYVDFDGTHSVKRQSEQRSGEAVTGGLHRYEPHKDDWIRGDPLWKREKGRNLIGALNYLSGKGANSISFLPYNVGGDGEDVWPFTDPAEKLHYDCSKLDQWGIIFDHALRKGIYLHFKLQEQENDDNRTGDKGEIGEVPAALDAGDLGIERRLYCRELVARFGYLLGLNWNLGEENTQSSSQQKEMANWIRDLDPYDHPIVVHTFPQWQDRVYPKLLGTNSPFTGASLQNDWDKVHQRTLQWLTNSEASGKKWVIANDEQGPANFGVPPDPGYQGHSGEAGPTNKTYNLHDIRKYTLWGNLMAGGAGVEYYFGYQLPQNDLACEDWRSRDKSWDYCRFALEFFALIPFWEMTNANYLIGNAQNDNSKYCFAKEGEVYAVYLPNGGTAEIELGYSKDDFEIRWYNPRTGGELIKTKQAKLKPKGKATLGPPPREPEQDWVLLVRRPIKEVKTPWYRRVFKTSDLNF